LAYVQAMKSFLVFLVALLMAGTLGVLFVGLFGMVRGGGDPRRANALMRWRVLLQAGALLLFALLMSLLRS
jgi:phosphatidylglycerophosphate synthase